MPITEARDTRPTDPSFDAIRDGQRLDQRLATEKASFVDGLRGEVFRMAASNLLRNNSFPRVPVVEDKEKGVAHLLRISEVRDPNAPLAENEFYLNTYGDLVKIPRRASSDLPINIHEIKNATDDEVIRLADIVVDTTRKTIAATNRHRRAEDLGRAMLKDNPGFLKR